MLDLALTALIWTGIAIAAITAIIFTAIVIAAAKQTLNASTTRAWEQGRESGIGATNPYQKHTRP